MTQAWTDNCFDPDHIAQNDLQAMENNFLTLKSSFSGDIAPSLAVVAGNLWFDTLNDKLYVRNSVGNWIGFLTGDIDQKLWIYRNDALTGWVIDSSVTDKVIAVKGGSTYTTGGTTAGTWVKPDHQHDYGFDLSGIVHNHIWYKYKEGVVGPEDGQGYWEVYWEDVGDYPIRLDSAKPVLSGNAGDGIFRTSDDDALSAPYSDQTGFASTTADYRPAAAVGTIQSRLP